MIKENVSISLQNVGLSSNSLYISRETTSKRNQKMGHFN